MPSCAVSHRPRAQFVEREAQARERAHAREKSDFVNRLGQEVVGAGLKSRQPVGGLIQRRHHDNRNMRSRRVGLEAAADLEPVHSRHHDVEQNDVAVAVGADLERVRAVAAGQDVEIIGRQASFKQFEIGSDVVDDQNARGHAAPLPARTGAASNKPETGEKRLIRADRCGWFR